MTREQIIHGLYRGDSKAIKEAIKALERQPCGDTISRADAVRVASGYCHPSNVAKELAKLPSVTPKPKMGHWIFDEILDRHYYCSECKSMGVDYWNYCPYCGCRMIEPQENEG